MGNGIGFQGQSAGISDEEVVKRVLGGEVVLFEILILL